MSALKSIKQSNFLLQRRYEAILFLMACNEKPGAEIVELMAQVKARKVPFGICITKLDEEPSKGMMIYLKKLRAGDVPIFEFSTVSPKQESLEEIFKYFESVLPDTPGPLYDPELYTNENLRDLVAEFIREPCFELLGQEIPFGLAVIIKSFKKCLNEAFQLFLTNLLHLAV